RRERPADDVGRGIGGRVQREARRACAGRRGGRPCRPPRSHPAPPLTRTAGESAMSGARRRVGPMQIILIPGLWLDAASCGSVVPARRDAGPEPPPLTLPGLGAPAAESGELRMSDWVDAVVAEIDRAPEPVVVVGHSGGGNVAWGAADARP